MTDCLLRVARPQDSHPADRWLCRALQVLRRVDPDRRREHSHRPRIHRLWAVGHRHLERRSERRRVEDRGSGKLQGAHRFVEHEDERVAARVHVQTSDPQGRKGWVQEQHAHLSHQRGLGASSLSANPAANAHFFCV